MGEDAREPLPIRRLQETLINRIAAGEVFQTVLQPKRSIYVISGDS